MPIIAINSESAFEAVVVSDTPAIITFCATWWGASKTIIPILEKLSEQPENKGLKFYTLDVDANIKAVALYNVRSVPTTLTLMYGQVVDQIVGLVTPSELADRIKKIVSFAPPVAAPASSTTVVTTIKDIAGFRQTIGSATPVVINFWATHCQQSKALDPIFEQLSKNPANKALKFYKINVEDNAAAVAEMNIRALPTVMIFKAGKPLGEVLGLAPTELTDLIKKVA
ncbi:Thioredoxin [Mycena venus]|uniref:Thioredoxin n=1 Tax=Mycena venus TaxID=2733690 RepID=A0A8H7CV17_9AGAR|nr:Thioredoxin [Mycena venus]